MDPGDQMSIAHRATEELRAAADLMSDAQRVANFGSWQWVVAEDQVSWSDQLFRIFGLDPRAPTPFKLTLQTYMDRVHTDDRASVQQTIEQALSDTRPFRFEHRIVRPNGDERAVRCQGEPVVDHLTQKIVRVVGVCQDVTELANVERARSEADARFRSAFENAPIGIALVDFGESSDGRITEVNRALCELSARTPDELIGSPLTSLSLAEDADLDEAMRERLISGDIERYSVEKRALLSDDRVVWLQLHVSTIPEVAGQRRRSGIVQVQDVTERKRFEEQLRYIADHDSLTGLMNRRRFREELDTQLALRRRYGGSGALLLIDVDRLKAVNDTRGHGAGDVVLRRVAEAMRGRVRATDVVARLAGDEFAVLLPNAEPEEAIALGRALIAKLAGEEVAGWGVSISVGVAAFGGDDEKGTTEDVMATADAAMYEAKQQGGSVAQLAGSRLVGAPHSRTEHAEHEEHFGRAIEMTPRRSVAPPSLADRVRRALADDSLLVYGQPVIDLRNGRVAHHELLVRMSEPGSDEVLAASEFLGAAAQTPGLCGQIDRWIVERALRMLANGSWGSRFQVNLSGETLSSDSSVDDLSELVEEADVEPGALGFEIAEGSVSRDFDHASEVFERLGASGCPLVLDGFSGGFGSFEYLQKLPLDQVKIEGNVTRALLGDDADHATFRAIVRLAQGTETTTVAKLVESDDIVPILRMHGVDMAQGFELGEPVPLGG